MAEEKITHNIEFPPAYVDFLYTEMERIFNIPGRETNKYLRSYLQEQYDALENKEGRVSLNAPTIKELKEYIGKKKGIVQE